MRPEPPLSPFPMWQCPVSGGDGTAAGAGPGRVPAVPLCGRRSRRAGHGLAGLGSPRQGTGLTRRSQPEAPLPVPPRHSRRELPGPEEPAGPELLQLHGAGQVALDVLQEAGSLCLQALAIGQQLVVDDLLLRRPGHVGAGRGGPVTAAAAPRPPRSALRRSLPAEGGPGAAPGAPRARGRAGGAGPGLDRGGTLGTAAGRGGKVTVSARVQEPRSAALRFVGKLFS